MAAARYRSGYLLPDSFRVHAYSIDQRPREALLYEELRLLVVLAVLPARRSDCDPVDLVKL